MSVPSSEQNLRRGIGPVLGIFLVINATIGTGIFKTPAQAARLAGSLPLVLGVWAAGGLIALCGTLSLAEVAAAHPRAGALYDILRRTYGPTAAYLLGWTKLTLLIPSAVGGFAKLGAEALAALLGLAPSATREAILAAALVAAAAAVNLLGVRLSAIGQGVVTAAKYVGVLALAGLGLFAAVPTQPATPVELIPSLGGALAALVAVMWAYDGWADLANLSGEMRDPERSLPRALAVGTLAIVVVYLLANFGYARTLGLGGLAGATTGSDMAAGRLARATLGAQGNAALSLLILVSCAGGAMTSLLTNSRIFVPLATDGLFIRWLGYVSPRTGVPARAVLVSAGLGATYVLIRTFEQLTEAFVVGFFPFYMMAVGAVYVYRRRGEARPFSVPGYPVTPAIFLAGASALIVGAVSHADATTLATLAVVVLGLPLGRFLRPADPPPAT